MGIALTLRNEDRLSYFKELMLGLLDLKIGNKVLICSGYFQEDYTTSKFGTNYYASKEPNLNGRTILDCIDSSYNEVVLVGSRAFNNGRDWDNSYEKFVCELRRNYGAIPKISAHKNLGGHWHAKVFILLKDEKPVAGIIGSSNMTKSAYASGKDPYFSIEADTMLFIPEIQNDTTKIVEELRVEENRESSIIIADYDPQKNGGRTEQDVLLDYYNRIMAEIKDKSNYVSF